MIACKTTLVVSGYASTSESTTNLKSLNSQARMTMLDRIVDLLLKCFPVAERLDVQKAQEGEHLVYGILTSEMLSGWHLTAVVESRKPHIGVPITHHLYLA